MKKIVLGLVVLILIALGGVALYITNIDWNQHKDKISEQFYNITGKTISFDGRVSFKIFPTPYLKAINAKIYNDDKKGNKPLLEISNLVAELALVPLLKGEFDVKKMILDGAVVNIDWDNDGLNWQSDLSPDQRQQMEDTKMVLNSVSLKNAVVNFESQSSDINFQLTNLNGEVSAQSVFGPFRIEGNYLKGASPEGFAISIGKMSDSYATSLNAVVTHPHSNSYVRFDGSFHLTNRVLNGNVFVEAKKFSDFVSANFSEVKIPQAYNKEVALGFDLALNPQNLNLSNMVIKYGDTQGAGEMQIPFDNGNISEVTANFDFATLELEPFVDYAKSFVKKYKEEDYAPEYGIDLMAEVKAIRATYQGQGLKNLVTEFSLDSDTFTVDDLSVVLPGDTSLKLKGSVYPYEDDVYYQAEMTISATDLLRTLKWLEFEPTVNTASIYKKMLATAKISGNFDKIQVSPYKITLDKSTLSGEAGIVLGERKDVMLVVNADTINFDNYIHSLPEEEKKKTWAERMAYRFSKLGMLNDFDLVLNAKADMVIYESMPFEKLDFKGNILNGNMDIEYCKVDQVANTAIGLKGKVSGFGYMPQMDNFQYEIKSSDVVSLINKLEIKVPTLDYNRFNNLNMSGMINGSIDNFGINNIATLGNLNANYQGKISKEAGILNFEGDLEVKHPDFVKLLDNLKVKYVPNAKNLGLFNAKAAIKGNKNNLDIKNLAANIGYTALSGMLQYDNTAERPNIITNLTINKFEIDKFLQKEKNVALINAQAVEPASFLQKPFWSKDKIDYSPYIYVDVNGNFDVQELSYKTYIFKDAKFRLESINGTALLNEFTANYRNTPLEATVSLHMTEAPTVSFNAKVNDALVNDFSFGGKSYNLKGGKFSTRFDFSSKADSEQSFAENLKGKAEFRATATEVGGVNLKVIYDDLIKRDASEGLAEILKGNVGFGKTLFDKLSGRIIVDNGQFSLADASMQTNNAEIKMYGEGNIDNWDMNVVFNVKYSEPKYLPEFSFSLRNGMDNPTVDVNASSLFKLYQLKEEEREAAKTAEIEAEKSYWDGLLKEQQKAVDDLVMATRNGLGKNIDELIQITNNQEALNKFNLLKQETANVLGGLVELKNNVNLEAIDNDAIETIKSALTSAMQKFEQYGQQVDEIYLADLKKQNETGYNKVVEAHNLLKQAVFSYNTQLDKYNERLSKIITDYSLSNDESFQSQKKNADDKIAELESLNEDTVKAQQARKEDASIEEYKQYNQKLSDVYTQLKEGKEQLVVMAKALEEYADPKLKEAEEAYYLKIEAEENQRMIEENTGSISIKKSGRTLTVTRDIDEIKNAEAEVSKEGVKVLDFSREKVSVAKPEQSTSGVVIKKGRNIRPN